MVRQSITTDDHPSWVACPAQYPAHSDEATRTRLIAACNSRTDAPTTIVRKLTDNPEPVREPRSVTTSPPDAGVVPSLAFWFTSLAAGALFAAVLVAPKWEQRESLRRRVAAIGAQCDTVEATNARLARVLDAFKHEPDYTLAIARSELDIVARDEVRLPAPAETPSTRGPVRVETPAETIWTPFLRLYAHDRVIRQFSLVTAAVFAVVALTFFNPPVTKT
jgi:cell division protein FtsB